MNDPCILDLSGGSFEWPSNGFPFTPTSFPWFPWDRHVAASECSYAAVRMDGGLVTWGSSHFGGDSQAVQERRGWQISHPEWISGYKNN